MTQAGQQNATRRRKNQGAIDSTRSLVHTLASVGRMFRVALLQWLAAGLFGSAIAAPVDERKPFGRVCIAVATGEVEESLQASSKPGPNTQIVVHADANERCQMLVFAFNGRDGKLMHDWLPQFVELPPSEEVLLPKAPIAWKWSAGSEPFEVDVLFVKPDCEDARRLKVLTTAMLRPMVNRRLLNRQSMKLYELATSSVAGPSEVVDLAKVRRVEVAAAYRGSTFPWRDYATGANFSEGKSALIIFRIGN